MLKILKSPFFYALLPSLFFYIYIFGHQWIPIHDTFHVTNTVFYLFNEYVQNGSLPLWTPFIAYGFTTNWFLALFLGPSLYLLIPLAKLLHGVNFLHFYYLSLFMDELILLVGTYMLARYLFHNFLSAIFVSVAMAGSTLWYAQIWWNFHLYYFLPLSLYFTLRGCKESSLWRILLGGTILVASSFGNLPSFPVIHGLIFFVFLLTSGWAYKLNLKLAFKKAGKLEGAILILLVFSTIAYLFFLTDIGQVITQRKGGGYTVDFENFLTYGESIGLNKFSELFTGTSWNYDTNIYAGILVFSFALFGLLWDASRKLFPFLLTGVFLFLLSIGKESFVAPLIYSLPGMPYYRHIDLVLPLIKFFLIILAGFGFDSFIYSLRGKEEKESSKTLALINIGILTGMFLICVLLSVVHSITQFDFKIFKLLEPQVFNFAIFDEKNFSRFANASEYVGRVVFVSLFYFINMFLFTILGTRGKKIGSAVVYALLSVHIVDILSYRTSLYQEYMVPVDKAAWNLFSFRHYPYNHQRVKNYDETSNFPKMAPYLSWKSGAVYDSMDLTLGIEPCQSKFRIIEHSPSAHQLYRAKADLSMDGSFEKIIGCEFPKIQLFETIDIAQTEDELKENFRDCSDKGECLLTDHQSYEQYQIKVTSRWIAMSGSSSLSLPLPETENRRLAAEIKVEGATADTLSFKVMTPQEEMRKGHWLYYADTWHPFWKATVNGEEVPILRANFAFKAIEIPSGEATVQFIYSRPLTRTILTGVGVGLAGSMILILWQVARLLRQNENETFAKLV